MLQCGPDASHCLQVAETIVGIAVIRRSIGNFTPLPEDLFTISLRYAHMRNVRHSIWFIVYSMLFIITARSPASAKSSQNAQCMQWAILQAQGMAGVGLAGNTLITSGDWTHCHCGVIRWL